jgi:hypothetical protein
MEAPFPWTDNGSGSFTTSASVLGTLGNPCCPKCNGIEFTRIGVDSDGSNEDIYGWNYLCKCGAKLLVVND